jgi:hypothetical protein
VERLQYGAPGHYWGFFPGNYAYGGDHPELDTPSFSLVWKHLGLHYEIPPSYLTWAFFLIAGIQAFITISMHCAELIVNCSRDEAVWRRMSSKTGLKRDVGVLTRALLSWESVTLFLFKAVIHWVYGFALSVYFSEGVVFRAPQIFYLAVFAAVLALMMTFITFRRPSGPQPATYGHLQTLADLIDHWPGKGENVFWGHKGYRNGVAHAGTASHELAAIHMKEEYMGSAFTTLLILEECLIR